MKLAAAAARRQERRGRNGRSECYQARGGVPMRSLTQSSMRCSWLLVMTLFSTRAFINSSTSAARK